MRTSPFAWLGARLFFLARGFACQLSKPDTRIFPNSRTTTREKDNDFQGWTIYTDGGRVSDGETIVDWSAVDRSPDERLYIMFGPVITTEAHLAYAGARDSNRTTLLNSRVTSRRYPSLTPVVLFLATRKLVSSTIPDTLPAFAWALYSHERTSPWGSPASIFC